ncbi:MAG: tripartite tricarboxylate transporter substrate binding protein [Betaproteobacteria bacterium]|nr:tripartite tricarboxylate transporter substrate binding protein [Betaproteobacteria bacterium]
MPSIELSYTLRALSLGAALAALALHGGANAADERYPAKPIRVVLPQQAGGVTDIVSRTLAGHLAKSLGQQVVIDNQAGANGIVAAGIVAKAAPDGYTLFMAVDSQLVVNPTLYKKLPYDPYADFTPISALARVDMILVAHPSVPASTLGELIAHARANPGKVHYASAGQGTQHHLGMELLKTMTQTSMVHVPYKGGPSALNDLLGGVVNIMFTGIPSALQFSKAGKVKMLAITTRERSSYAPQLPTMSESGAPGFELNAWFGMLAPARTPAAIINTLSQEVAKVAANPDFRNTLRSHGIEPLGTTPEAMLALMKSDTEKWARVIRESGAQIE